MKIIGHRGAAGLAPENTLVSLQKAIRTGVDAVEFDVRLSSDSQLVLCHDTSLNRIANRSEKVQNLTASELHQVQTISGEPIPTLEEALKVVDLTPVFIEAKGNNWARVLNDTLRKQKDLPKISVIAFNHRELTVFSELYPRAKTYAIERTSPFEAIHKAHLLGFTGVDFNFWLLNPFTYFAARRSKLNIIVYTVNSVWVASYFRLFFPNVSITTNFPERMRPFLAKKKARIA